MVKISKSLTWDDLAREYKKVTGNSAYSSSIEAIFEWAEKQTDKFFVDYEKKSIHKIKGVKNNDTRNNL